MVSFEEIKSTLNSEEKILWKKQNYTNELKELRFTLNILIFTVGISIFSLLFYFLTSTINIDVMLSFVISLTIFLISGFPLYLFFKIYSEYKKIIKRLELKLSNLRRYEEFFILTNKRWIQKSFYLAKIDNFNYKSDLMVKQKDLAFVNLDNIEVIYISPQKKVEMFQVNFFRLWDKNSEESIFRVNIGGDELQEIMKTLQEIFQITKEEHEVIKYRDSAFYCKKKKEI